MNQTQRSKLIEAFKRHNKVNCISIENDDEGSFNPNGCDVCNSLAQDTYVMSGYAPKTKEVLELGDVCHDCICVEYNGIEDGSNQPKTKA